MYLVSFALPTALYPPGKCSSDIFLSPLFQACLQVLVLTWVGTYLPDDASGFLGKFNIYTMVEQLSQSPFPLPPIPPPPPPNFHDNLLIHLHHLCFCCIRDQLDQHPLPHNNYPSGSNHLSFRLEHIFLLYYFFPHHSYATVLIVLMKDCKALRDKISFLVAPMNWTRSHNTSTWFGGFPRPGTSHRVFYVRLFLARLRFCFFFLRRFCEDRGIRIVCGGKGGNTDRGKKWKV